MDKDADLKHHSAIGDDPIEQEQCEVPIPACDFEEMDADLQAHYSIGYGRIERFEKDRRRDFVHHKRHVFLCYGRSHSWCGDFVLDPYSLPGKLLSAFRSREGKVKTKTILTVCQGSAEARLEDGDVLIFPDMVKYRLKTSSVDSFVEDVLVNDRLWFGSAMKRLREGSYVFVCAHGGHDRRSGYCGQLVMEKMNELVDINNLKDEVFPIPCSDIGVPEFAANLIIFGRNGEMKIDGHWYSYVCPNYVSNIIYDHIGGGELYHLLWRGKMGDEKNGEPWPIFEFPPWWWRGQDGSYGRKNHPPWTCWKEGIEMITWWGKYPVNVEEEAKAAEAFRKRHEEISRGCEADILAWQNMMEQKSSMISGV